MLDVRFHPFSRFTTIYGIAHDFSTAATTTTSHCPRSMDPISILPPLQRPFHSLLFLPSNVYIYIETSPRIIRMDTYILGYTRYWEQEEESPRLEIASLSWEDVTTTRRGCTEICIPYFDCAACRKGNDFGNLVKFVKNLRETRETSFFPFFLLLLLENRIGG